MLKTVHYYWLSKLAIAFHAAGNTVQMANAAGRPTTILRTTTPQYSTSPAGKQIITVHKSGNTNQPQIVTLVKTTQGMTVAPVSTTLHAFLMVQLINPD